MTPIQKVSEKQSDLRYDPHYLLRAEVLKHAVATLTGMIPPISTQIVVILTRQCCDAVAPVKSTLAQIRVSKRPPSEPSPFVPGILRPIKVFFGIQTNEGPGEAFRDAHLKPYTSDVFDAACRRCVSCTS
jgi:hypothetical protein